MAKRRTKAELAFHKALSEAVRAKALDGDVFKEVQEILDGHATLVAEKESLEKRNGENIVRARDAEYALEKFKADHAAAIKDIRIRENVAKAQERENAVEAGRNEAAREAIEWMRSFATDVVRAPTFRRTVDTTVPVVVPGLDEGENGYAPRTEPRVEELPTRTTTEDSQE